MVITDSAGRILPVPPRKARGNGARLCAEHQPQRHGEATRFGIIRRLWASALAAAGPSDTAAVRWWFQDARANPRRFVLAAISMVILSLILPLSTAAAAPPAREAIEWCDIWITHANETNLPRVLLIGDSIVRDYYPEVEKRFAGKAFVGRLATSRFVADPVLLKEIESVLSGAKFDVILFNNGMHGWQHSEKEYRKAFPKFIKTIRAHAPKAKLIWATTTPLRNGKDVTYDTKAEYSDERIAARNALAGEVVAVQKIPTVDLNAAVRGRPELHSDNVHFNGQGSQILAAQVYAAVEKLLPR